MKDEICERCGKESEEELEEIRTENLNMKICVSCMNEVEDLLQNSSKRRI